MALNPTKDHEGRWGWMLAQGILIILVGILALVGSILTTLITVSIFGVLLLLGGIILTLYAFETRRWSGFWMHFLLGILYVFTGVYLFISPGSGALVLTLLMAAFFIASGFIRIISAVIRRFHGWGWFIFSGLLAVLLGILIWIQWPISGLYIIGTFVGIELLLVGSTLVILAFQARKQYKLLPH